MAPLDRDSSGEKAYIITGPTSGIGRRTALELGRHGTVVLAGRDRSKLDDVQRTIARRGGKVVSVVCDLSDLASVRRAAAQIIELAFPSSDCSTTPASHRPSPPRTRSAGT